MSFFDSCCGAEEIPASTIQMRDEDEDNPDVTGFPIFENEYVPGAAPNVLHQALEERQWNYASLILDGKDKGEDQKQAASSNAVCFSPQSNQKKKKQSIARNKVLAMTWVVGKDKDSGKRLWRNTPLHTAMKTGAPLTIVKKLLEMHPPAVMLRDMEGELPIHMAFREGLGEDIITELLDAHPESTEAKNKRGMDPLQCTQEGSEPRRVLFHFIARGKDQERREGNERMSKREAELTEEHKEIIEVIKAGHREHIAKIMRGHEEHVHEIMANHECAIERLREAHGEDVTALEVKIRELESNLLVLTLEMNKEERDSAASFSSTHSASTWGTREDLTKFSRFTKDTGDTEESKDTKTTRETFVSRLSKSTKATKEKDDVSTKSSASKTDGPVLAASAESMTVPKPSLESEEGENSSSSPSLRSSPKHQSHGHPPCPPKNGKKEFKTGMLRTLSKIVKSPSVSPVAVAE